MPAKVISFMNSKGGVGKTTSAVHIAGGFAHRGNKVLLIDGDYQGSATTHYMGDEIKHKREFYHGFFVDGLDVEDTIVRRVAHNLDLIPQSPEKFRNTIESFIGNWMEDPDDPEVTKYDLVLIKLVPFLDEYDYIIFDGPPAGNHLSYNILRATDLVIAPLPPEYYDFNASKSVVKMYRQVLKTNKELVWGGWLVTKYNLNTRNNFMKKHFNKIDMLSDAAGLRMFNTVIRSSLLLAESGEQKKEHIFDYSPKSPGAEDYGKLCEEIETLL